MRVGPYRFFFWSNERSEPPHIHAESADGYAKFWLRPVELAENRGYNSRHLGRIRQLVEQHRDELMEQWRDYFTGG